MKRFRTSMLKRFAMTLLATLFAAVPLVEAVAFQNDEGNNRSRQRAPSLSTSVAQGVQKAVELAQTDPPQYQAAIAELNKVITNRGDRLQGYDKATVYEVRGSYKVQLEDLAGGLRDFQTAVNTNALPADRANNLRYFIAQINFQLENFDAAISGLQDWLRISSQAGEDPPANAYYLLGVAYIQKEDFRSAQQPLERALRLKNAENQAAGKGPERSYYDALNVVYSQNRQYSQWADHLETMINVWPEDAALWKQLAGAYGSQEGRDREAFSVLEVAYRSGLLTTESEVLQLVQYYSFFENAYRGGRLLEREMNAGVVERNKENLVFLSQLWDQSREVKRALPILEEAANSGDGELLFRFGRVLVADEQYTQADRILLRAINSGDLSRKDLADAWMLLGNARFSQAGPDDRAQLRRARQAFQSAARYPRTRRVANNYVTYINEVIRVQELQEQRAREEFAQLCENALDRLGDAQRINQIQGRALDDLSEALTADLRECGYDTNGNPIPGSAAAAAAAAEQSNPEESDATSTNDEDGSGE